LKKNPEIAMFPLLTGPHTTILWTTPAASMTRRMTSKIEILVAVSLDLSDEVF
jgi:hypothetical protein